MRPRLLLLTILAAVLPVAALSAQAASATLSLSGTVAAETTITVSSNSNASGLDLTSSQTDLQVGTVTWTSNNPDGFRVVITSSNANGSWQFEGASDSLNYTLSIGGTEYTPSGGEVEVANTSGPTGESGVQQPITISFDGSDDFLNEGSYSDTLNFEIYSK